MQRPSVTQSLLGMALLAYAVSGYLPSKWPSWASLRLPTVASAEATSVTYKHFRDKQVALDLPSGWRWLAQKPDPEEANASYFALSRFQGQNVLRAPVSVRVDGIPNSRKLSPEAMLDTLAKGAVDDPGAVKRLAALPKGAAGMTYAANINGHPVTHYVFVKSGDMLSYVLSIGSADERFKPEMANRVFQSLQITL